MRGHSHFGLIGIAMIGALASLERSHAARAPEMPDAEPEGADVPSAPMIESRQVRRARERAQAKSARR